MAENEGRGGKEPHASDSLASKGQTKGNQLNSTSAPTSTANSSASNPTAHQKKRRKRRAKAKRDGAMQGAVASDVATGTSTATTNSPALQPSPPGSSPKDQQHTLGSTSSSSQRDSKHGTHSGFGKNRLARGFTDLQSSSNALSWSQTHGTNQPNVIELSDSDSDDQVEHSDGGMAVNIISSDESESDHWVDQEIDRLSQVQPASSDANTKAKDPVRGSALRLADLNPDDLEDQLKYALYHLQRHQIDLNRPVTCLGCLSEGHMVDTCLDAHRNAGANRASHPNGNSPEKGTHSDSTSPHSFFPRHPTDSNLPVQLWISCCICASKSHLVADCPDLDDNAAAERWSLKALGPAEITNLSLQTGIREREREAESRGMRPPGMNIRGRADLHQAGAARAHDAAEDDHEPFIKPPVASRRDPSRPQIQLGQYWTQQRPSDSHERFDSRNGPSHEWGRSSGGGRNSWYATDSFGQRRSRSPEDTARSTPMFGDSWRAAGGGGGGSRGGRGRPPPSRRFDGWRPASNSDSHPQPPPSGRNQVKMQLPTRKGSNTNLSTSGKQTTTTTTTTNSSNNNNNSNKKTDPPAPAGKSDSGNVVNNATKGPRRQKRNPGKSN